MAEVRRWHAWVRQNDAVHPLYDNTTVPVPATSDGGFFPLQASGRAPRQLATLSREPVDSQISAAYKALGALGHILRSRWAKPELKDPL